jgi:4-hydroxy-2-oxoheptanedioate aldolase
MAPSKPRERSEQAPNGGAAILGRMLVNAAKQKMLAGQPAYGYSLGLGSPLAAELLARTGIDFLLLETQHGSWGHDGAIAALMAMAGGSATPMARVAKNDYFLIGKLLDQGALGIVVPMVDTADQARAAADACRLPPRGRRSWGVGRARVYGDDYADWIDDQLFVAVQLESATAVENAEAIMATPGIDGCWAGPADLALSMGIHPRDAARDDRHGRALERIVAACRATGKIAGLACPTPEDARRRADAGFQFLTAGGDAGFLLDGARAGLRVLGLGGAPPR